MNRWQARTEQHAPKRTVDDVIIENGPGKGTEYFRNEYGVPFQEPFRPRSLVPGERCLKPPSGTSRGLDGNPDRTKCHHRIACELRTHRRDTPPSLDRGTRQSEGDRGGRTELTGHARSGQISDNEKPEPGRVFSPSQSPVWDLNSPKRRMSLPPGQTQSSEKGDLNLVLSFPRTRPQYGI